MLMVWDANGRIIVNTNDKVGRFAPTPIYVTKGQSGSVNLPGGTKGFAFAIPVVAGTMAANVYMTATQITWNYDNTGDLPNGQPLGDCYIYYGNY